MKKKTQKKTPKMPTLPKFLELSWETDLKNLPKEHGIYAVLCFNKEEKEYWFTFGEFIKDNFSKLDYSEWRILGPIHGTSFALGSDDNWFDVVAWTKTKRVDR